MIAAMITRISIFALVIGLFTSIGFAQKARNDQLNGTFKIDRGKSEDVSATAESIASSKGLSDSEKEELEDQLTAPETVTIKIDSNRPGTVTLATSSSAESTFNADGSIQRIRQSNGSEINVSASLRGGTLRLSKVGGGNSFSITFTSTGNGSGLKVTRMLTTDRLDETVFADSYYFRDRNSSSYPTTNRNDDDGSYSSSDPDDQAGRTSGGRSVPSTRKSSGRFVVPKGVVLTGSLDNKITTKASQDNDRFTMTISSPSDYDGAVIEGFLSGIKRTGRATGKSNITFNFESIKLRSGEVYDFVGILKNVTDSTGKIIEIGDEGSAKGKSRTKDTLKRGGIGAGLGAVLGAIIGGGKGALIGATIGGGAGAGSVIVQGKEDIELLPGSQVQVESSSPKF